MKYFTKLTFLFLFFSFEVLSQDKKIDFPIDKTTKRITYTEVIVVDSSLSKNELYSNAREWFAKTYNSSLSVIQMDDKELGKIVGKASIPVHFTSLGMMIEGGFIHYTISLQLKDGRYKYEITDFNHVGTYVNGKKEPDGGRCEDIISEEKTFWGNSYRRTYEKYLFQMNENILSLILNLKENMNKSNGNLNKDDW